MPKAYIFDLDGTIFNHHHRLHHIMKDDKEWEKFKEECDKDPPMPEVGTILVALAETAEILFVTGRSEAQRGGTEVALLQHFPSVNYHLFMRKDGDFRADVKVKSDIYEREIKRFWNVIAVFEDRTRVVEMWRSLGLVCLQVNEGDY